MANTKKLLVALAAILAFGAPVLAAGIGSPAQAEHHKKHNKTLSLNRVQTGLPQLIFKDEEGKEETYLPLSPDATIMLNGETVGIESLHPKDQLKLTYDDAGRVSQVAALRIINGAVLDVDQEKITVTPDYLEKFTYTITPGTHLVSGKNNLTIGDVVRGVHVQIMPISNNVALHIEVKQESPLGQFWHNLTKNLFKPLLLFFYFGFLIVLLRVPFEFPYAVYQGLTIYLLVAIGWHGGEELANLSQASLMQAGLYMAVGFIANLLVGMAAWLFLKRVKKLRAIDAATVAGYYGSDSAGTFLTCMGVLQTASIAYAAYMPVMLAVMEIPGCLVCLFLVSRLRHRGMDVNGNMPGEHGYEGPARPVQKEGEEAPAEAHSGGIFNLEILREIFLNPGLFLLIGGIAIGFVSRLQGPGITEPDDQLFVSLFQGMLCLFLLEMGMNAARRIRDLKAAGKTFIAFGLIAPNLFAIFGIIVTSLFSHLLHQPLQLGTYVLFSVLCAAASYIAVPAIQRLAIPEASPTLPLAASLGLTFTYNVTIGIPLYLVISETVIRMFPVV